MGKYFVASLPSQAASDDYMRSGTGFEEIASETRSPNEQEMKTPTYLTNIDPKNPNYSIHYRAEK